MKLKDFFKVSFIDKCCMITQAAKFIIHINLSLPRLKEQSTSFTQSLQCIFMLHAKGSLFDVDQIERIKFSNLFYV